MVRDVWEGFARKFDAQWRDSPTGDLMTPGYWDYPGGAEAFARVRAKTVRRLLQEAAGHGGVKFLRRMMGIVNVWDIESIEDLETRAVAERAAIRIGSRWLMERRQFESVNDLTRIVEEETRGIVP